VTGDWSGAAQDLEEALGIHHDIGDLGGEVDALNESGKLYLARGDLSRATSCHQQALDLARQIASSPDEAQALSGLGHCALVAGQAARAADLLAELDTLTGPPPARQA
jgi:tetratricopeptide (TPR) repeat protein